MRENSRLIKSHSIIKYKAYTALLEGRINKREHDLLVELGFMDKIKSFFGGGMEVGGDLAKLFKDKVNQKQFQLAKESITKVVADLKAIAKKAGIDDSVVALFLKGVLDEAGVAPADIAAAKPSDSEGDAGGGEEVAAGTEVSAETIKNNPAAAAKIVADATGQPVEKVEADLEKNKPDVAAISAVLGNSIGNSEGVDGEIATKVVKALIDKGHLKLEGRKNLTRSGLLIFVNEVKNINSQHEVMNRWLQLAGIHDALLAEKKDPKKNQEAFKKIMDSIEGAKIKTVDELTKQLADLGQNAQLSNKMKDELKAAFEKKNPKEDKKEIEKVVDAVPEPEVDKEAEETKQKFAAVLKDIKSVVPDADEDVISKIISAINRFKSVKIAA